MTFADEVAADVAATFLNADEFAESVVYTPTGGAAVTITAVVDREAEAVEYEAGRLRARSRVIHCADDAATGIDHASLTLLEDTIKITADDADAVWPVVEVVECEAGILTVRVERADTDEISSDDHRLQRR